MNICFNNGLYLASDSRNFKVYKLFKYIDNSTKKEATKEGNLKYFNTLNQAINYILMQTIRESEATSLKEVKVLIEDFKEFINRELDI